MQINKFNSKIKYFTFFIVLVIFLASCAKNEFVEEEQETNNFNTTESFKEWAGNRLQPIDTDIPGVDAYNYYPSRNSEPQTIYIKNMEKGGVNDDILVGGMCDKELNSVNAPGVGNILTCTGEGDKCTYSNVNGNLILIICGEQF